MRYLCNRCGYSTDFPTNFKKHLSSKRECEPTFISIDRSVIYDRYFGKNDYDYTCDICGNRYKTIETLRVHKSRIHPQVEKKTMLKNVNETDEERNLRDKLLKQQSTIHRLKLDILYYKSKKLEVFYQKLLEYITGGQHKKLKCGITDVTTDDSHCEIKEWRFWKDAIGQLTVYNVENPKPKLAVYLFGKYSDSNKNDAFDILKNTCHFDVYEFVAHGDRINIVNFEDKTVVHTYSPDEEKEYKDVLIQ